jgi:hypothetical protein
MVVSHAVLIAVMTSSAAEPRPSAEVVGAGGGAVVQAPAELQKAIEQHTAAMNGIAAEVKARTEAVKKWYPTALEALEKDAMARGDLDGVLAAKRERERIGRPLTPEEMATQPAAFRAVRQKYDAALEGLATQEKTRELTCVRDYVAALEGMQRRLTMRDEIAAAVKVKEEATRAFGQQTELEVEVRQRTVPSAPALVAATPAPALPPSRATAAQLPAAPTGTTPPAAKAPSTPVFGSIMSTKTNSVAKALEGAWYFKWDSGYDADYTFSADGTFKGSQRGGPDGTWRVVGQTVLMEAPPNENKTIHLPIKPDGTKITDSRKGRTIMATKKGPAAGS